MEVCRVVIPLKLPSLNTYINECRKNKYAAAKMKTDVEKQIGLYLTEVPKFEHPIKIHFTWIEGNKRRDYDNASFSKKFILDALVKCGKLKDDNRKCVYAFTDSFEYSNDGSFKVILDIEEDYERENTN